jgi:ABC-type iron transport system FetAB ATPase subunit
LKRAKFRLHWSETKNEEIRIESMRNNYRKIKEIINVKVFRTKVLVMWIRHSTKSHITIRVLKEGMQLDHKTTPNAANVRKNCQTAKQSEFH